jgi:hypothetical protein
MKIYSLIYSAAVESVNAKSLASERNRRRRVSKGATRATLSKHFFSSEGGQEDLYVPPSSFYYLILFFFMLGETDAPSSVYREEGRYSFSSDKRRHSAHPAPS